jgi:hypothetical protein
MHVLFIWVHLGLACCSKQSRSYATATTATVSPNATAIEYGL